MKHIACIFLFSLIFGSDLFAQKISGLGGELSLLSLKPNYRDWVSKETGFELFGGIAAEFNDIKPNDFEAGFKFLHALIYTRTDRTYIGVVGKYKWINLTNADSRASLPIPGFIVGKEWYSKRIHRKGIAIELGYQIGSTTYSVPINYDATGKKTFTEFPLIVNFRYTFYTKR